MAFDLSKTLVIGISATALFDMSESDLMFTKLYEENKDLAIRKYREFMFKHEDNPLQRGTGYALVEALLNLNKFKNEQESPLVEVIIMSRNSPDTGLRVLNSIRHYQLNITRSAFTAGETVVDYLDAFNVDLFLTTNVNDAQRVIDSKLCAAAVLKAPPKIMTEIPSNQVRIAFDGDAVLFSEESELVYKTQGIKEFHKKEDEQQNIPLADGPYANLLRKLAVLQKRIPITREYSPVRIALVTARNSPSEMRVIKTLRHWGVYVDEAFFLGGVDKSKVLTAFKAHIFFDDQDVHLDVAANLISSGKVPHPSTSKLKALEKSIKQNSQ